MSSNKEQIWDKLINTNNLKDIKEYILLIKSFEKKYKWGKILLLKAAKKERYEILKYLIEQGFDVNYISKNGNSYLPYSNALHFSAYFNKKSTRCLELLLKNMSQESINKKNGVGFTPLDCAYHNDSPIQNDIVELIRQHGGKANCYDKYGNKVGEGQGDLNEPFSIKIIMPAVEAGDVSTVNKIAKFYKIDFSLNEVCEWECSHFNCHYMTPLMLASEYHHVNLITYLLRNGADPSFVNDDGNTALSFTLGSDMEENGRYDTVKILLNDPRTKRTINETSFMLGTPLDIAINNSLEEKIINLIKNNGGQTSRSILNESSQKPMKKSAFKPRKSTRDRRPTNLYIPGYANNYTSVDERKGDDTTPRRSPRVKNPTNFFKAPSDINPGSRKSPKTTNKKSPRGRSPMSNLTNNLLNFATISSSSMQVEEEEKEDWLYVKYLIEKVEREYYNSLSKKDIEEYNDSMGTDAETGPWTAGSASDAKAAINFLMVKLAQNFIRKQNYHVFTLDGIAAASSRTFHDMLNKQYEYIHVANGNDTVCKGIRARCPGIKVQPVYSQKYKIEKNKRPHLIYYDGTMTICHGVPGDLWENRFNEIYKWMEDKAAKGGAKTFIDTLEALMPYDTSPVVLGVTFSLRNMDTLKWKKFIQRKLKRKDVIHRSKEQRRNTRDKWNWNMSYIIDELLGLIKGFLKNNRKDDRKVWLDQGIFYKHEKDSTAKNMQKGAAMAFVSIVINPDPQQKERWRTSIGLAKKQREYFHTCEYSEEGGVSSGLIVLPQSRCYNFTVLGVKSTCEEGYCYYIDFQNDSLEFRDSVRYLLNVDYSREQVEEGNLKPLREKSLGPKRHQLLIMKPNNKSNYCYLAMVSNKFINVEINREGDRATVYVIMWYMPEEYGKNLWKYNAAGKQNNNYGTTKVTDFKIRNIENSKFIPDAERNKWKDGTVNCVWIRTHVSAYTETELLPLVMSGWEWNDDWPSNLQGWYWNSKNGRGNSRKRMSPSITEMFANLKLKF